MDLNYSPEDVAYRKQVRAWLEQNSPSAPPRTLDERVEHDRDRVGLDSPSVRGCLVDGPLDRKT